MKLVRDSGRALNGVPQFVGRPEWEPSVGRADVRIKGHFLSPSVGLLSWTLKYLARVF